MVQTKSGFIGKNILACNLLGIFKLKRLKQPLQFEPHRSIGNLVFFGKGYRGILPSQRIIES